MECKGGGLSPWQAVLWAWLVPLLPPQQRLPVPQTPHWGASWPSPKHTTFLALHFPTTSLYLWILTLHVPLCMCERKQPAASPTHPTAHQRPCCKRICWDLTGRTRPINQVFFFVSTTGGLLMLLLQPSLQSMYPLWCLQGESAATGSAGQQQTTPEHIPCCWQNQSAPQWATPLESPARRVTPDPFVQSKVGWDGEGKEERRWELKVRLIWAVGRCRVCSCYKAHPQEKPK